MKPDVTAPLLLTIEDVLRMTGYKSRSSVLRLVKQQRLPAPVVVGGGRVRWRASEIDQWLNSLPTQTYR